MRTLSPLLIILLLTVHRSIGQNVGIGTTTPHAAAILEMSATNRGFLPPRLTSLQKTGISNPPVGLVIYDSTVNQLQVFNGTSWTNSGGPGGDYWQSVFTGSEQQIRNNNTTYRRVMLGDRPIQPSIGYSNSSFGAFTVWSKANGVPDFVNYLTMDGQGIQSRTQNITMAGNPFDDNLVLNPYGANVGIGTWPVHSRLEVAGTVGASSAMFGVGKAGISIHADNPEVGFNYYYNGGPKTMKAGYGANIGMNPFNGDMYLGTFSGYTTNADFGSLPSNAYQQVMTIKQNGLVGIGEAFPQAKLQVITNLPTGPGIIGTGKGMDTVDVNTGYPYRIYTHHAGITANNTPGGAALQIEGPVTVPNGNKDFVFNVNPQNSDSQSPGYYYELGNGFWAMRLDGADSPIYAQGWRTPFIFVQPFFSWSAAAPAGFNVPTVTSVYYNSTYGGVYCVLNTSPVVTAHSLISLTVMVIRNNPSAVPL